MHKVSGTFADVVSGSDVYTLFVLPTSVAKSGAEISSIQINSSGSYAGFNSVTVAGSSGGTGGLDQAAVDARVAALTDDWAETANPLTRIPVSKLPADVLHHADSIWDATFTGKAGSQSGTVESDGGADNNLATGTDATNFAFTVSGDSGTVRRFYQDNDNDLSLFINGAVGWQTAFAGHAMDLNGSKFLFSHAKLVVPNTGDGWTEFTWDAPAGLLRVGSNTAEFYEPVDDDNYLPAGETNEIVTYNTDGHPVSQDMTADILLAGSGETIVTGPHHSKPAPATPTGHTACGLSRPGGRAA